MSYSLTPSTPSLKSEHENESTYSGFTTLAHSQTTLVKPKDETTEDLTEVESGWTTNDYHTPITTFSKKEQKRIIRRIDLRVVVLLGSMYALSMIDRATTAIALITGMGKDLELIGERYNLINAMFFVPYVIFQMPSTVVMRKIGPRTFLTATTLLWGATTIASGFVRTWTQLLAMRILLGAWEAGFFPGCMYLLQCWYPRYDLARRNALFFLLGLIPAAFGGIMSYGMSRLEGLGSGPAWWGAHIIGPPSSPTSPPTITYGPGVAGWRWIFFFYGTATCLIGLFGWAFVVDFPEKILQGRKGLYSAHFLTKEEAAWVIERIEKDRQDVTPPQFKISEYLIYAWDLKIWLFAILYGLSALVGYAVGFSLPIILMDNMGCSLVKAQCLGAPPFLTAAIATWIIAHYSDKMKVRSPFLLMNNCLIIVGLSLMAFVNNTAVQYFGVFFATLPGCANAPVIMTWQANNIRGQWKRALVSAFGVGAGALGGMAGSFAFRMQDKPHFYPGYGVCIGATGLAIFVILWLDLMFARANIGADNGGKVIEGLVGFRYTL